MTAAFKHFIMKAIAHEVMTQITRLIVAELDPEEIILFGSHAWGTPHKHSDIDLCVIVPDGIPGFDRIEWGVRALNALNDLTIDVDVMVTTRSVIDTFKTVPASLQRKIVEQGKLLYAKGKNSPGEVLVEKSAT
ncbi:nucleotidyltransferase domain-containing protein [Chroococcidiopsis sp. CCNUC1]|uniref:nucleotidyltransferase domain-containing protein n=1 Tax=Chroococcidiopsis sp. CCNUC1 TaxID=2653189 RepID=UPI0020204AC0|nr:nucleotidyltransferase domain-containing protein [Chroococcidiopsis sp. CCNUC1]URD51243.1 nucleotidyltransferase domain-containing protein [Chroococcidiopsis sp. CCNUC1]